MGNSKEKKGEHRLATGQPEKACHFETVALDRKAVLIHLSSCKPTRGFEFGRHFGKVYVDFDHVLRVLLRINLL